MQHTEKDQEGADFIYKCLPLVDHAHSFMRPVITKSLYNGQMFTRGYASKRLLLPSPEEMLIRARQKHVSSFPVASCC